jgi:hypothetical protein
MIYRGPGFLAVVWFGSSHTSSSFLADGSGGRGGGGVGVALQIILDLCIPEKELAKTRSRISLIYFQNHS